MRERIGTYALGVALGCVIAGFIFVNRSREKSARATSNPPTQETGSSDLPQNKQ